MSDDKGIVRVLHITEELSAAGIESFIMNMYRRIDRNKVQFDFLVLRNQKEFYDEEITLLGGKKFFVHSENGNTLIRVLEESKQIYSFLKKHPYDIVHVHYTTPLRAPYLYAAKMANVKVRIYHSHSAYIIGKSKSKMLIYNFMKGKIGKWATHCFACSQAAADWIFPETVLKEKKEKIIYNGIDVEKFKFDLSAKEEIRKELGIEDKFVLIHTGRFTEQKNQSFVLDVFAELIKRNPNSALILLGKGEMFDEMKKKASVLGVKERVFFPGVKDDVQRYLSAADCYIMPSLYEGLPVAAVEAQCSGVSCVLSTNITKEIDLTNDVQFVSLEAPICEWVEAVMSCRGIEHKDNSQTIKEKGYDVQSVAYEMQKFYSIV